MSQGYATRTPAQTLWVAGAAGLVGLLLVGGGWLVWQGLTTGTTPSRHDTAEPLAPARLTADEVAFGAPVLVEGVPWGFPLTGDGAVAAAVSAVAVTGQPEVVFDPARFEQAARVVFTTEAAAAAVRQVEAARTEFELSGWAAQPASRRLYFFAPLAARLTRFDAAGPTARVEVWALTLVGVGDAGGAVFTTSTLELTADPGGGTWTVTQIDTVEGPTPLVAPSASAPGRTRALLRDATATWPLPLPRESSP